VLEAHQTTIDISGAYFHGTPIPFAEGGRLLYAAVPTWLAHYDYPDRRRW
jgi:hypothetical protein